jgi:GAF domain-containing protein
MSDEVMVVEDARTDDRFAGNPMVVGEPRIRFYAGAPVTYAPGLHIGSVCAFDRRPRSFKAAEKHMLASYAGIVVSQLRLMAAARLLRRGFEDRARLESEIALLRRAER